MWEHSESSWSPPQRNTFTIQPCSLNQSNLKLTGTLRITLSESPAGNVNLSRQILKECLARRICLKTGLKTVLPLRLQQTLSMYGSSLSVVLKKFKIGGFLGNSRVSYGRSLKASLRFSSGKPSP